MHEAPERRLLALLSVGSTLRPPDWPAPAGIRPGRDGWFDRMDNAGTAARTLRSFRDWWHVHAHQDFSVPDGTPPREVLRRLVLVRRAIRYLAEGDTADYQRLRARLLHQATFRLDAEGEAQPAASGWQAFATALLPALIAIGRTPDRVRYCANESCRWLFVDLSRSGRRRWCHPASCGNRMKVRAFRARQRHAAESLRRA